MAYGTTDVHLAGTRDSLAALTDQASEEQTPLDGEVMAPTAEEGQFQKLMRWADARQTRNIAEEIDTGELGSIGMRVVEEYEIDLESRIGWYTEAKAALEMSMQRAVAKSTPWAKSANVILPMITEASDQFAARAYPAIVQDNRIVKGIVYGEDEGEPQMVIDPASGMPAVNPATGQPQPVMGQDGKPVWAVPPGEKQKIADRVGEHMSWQLLEEQTEWETETDTMLHILPIVGCYFRKSYFDPVMGRNMSLGVNALNLVINYWAKSMDLAPRMTEEVSLYPFEIKEYQASGFYLPGDFGIAWDAGLDRDKPHIFLEQHRRLDLDEDGYPEPYIVTVHKDTQKVVRIVARYDVEGFRFALGNDSIVKIVPIQYYTKYDFLPNKEGGIYGQGLGQLLKPLNEAANTTLNMMLDSAHLQVVGGGFIGRGLSMASGTVRFKLGEWKFVNAPGNEVRNAVVPLNHAGPNMVLFQLLGLLMEAGKDVSSVKDVLSGELKAQTMSPTVFMALVEQGLKVFTAIWKRIHRSLKSEFDKLYRLNRLYLEDEASYKAGNQWKHIKRSDYDQGAGVSPISDATMVADVQKMARAQFLQQFLTDGQMDGIEIRRRMLEAAGIPDIDTLLKVNPAPDPLLLIELAKVEIQKIEVKARAIMNIAAGIKSLADADAAVKDNFRQWAEIQYQSMREELDGLSDSKAAPGTGGANPGKGSGVASPSGDQGLPPVPQGLSGGPAAAALGEMGARPAA